MPRRKRKDSFVRSDESSNGSMVMEFEEPVIELDQYSDVEDYEEEKESDECQNEGSKKTSFKKSYTGPTNKSCSISVSTAVKSNMGVDNLSPTKFTQAK
eukprot:CAMPEP_0168350032 /NCGR_PEP_ID=MMETSP0213-20121227/20840_1 /TAXON_ID=151035 /ORGANISM="Euplotes harpa, Strain FSP1.4" /LENGTH=98 /DNA_ID=CAMNT_0008360227 /DNA_START=185 /DNA_END=481 /DNA_ORIENTATION=+